MPETIEHPPVQVEQPVEKSQIEKNIAAYASAYKLCLGEAAELIKKSSHLQGRSAQEIATVLFNRFYDDQIEIRSQMNRGRQDPALVEILQRAIHRL